MARPRSGGGARYDDRPERHHARDSHRASKVAMRRARSTTNRCICVRSNLRSEKGCLWRGESNKEPTMKRLFALSGIVIALLAVAPCALAQSSPPPLPSLTPQQSATLDQRLDSYRRQTEDRVSRREITADEAER